jgi:sirohydrochlorin cobaltochelatase
VSDDGRASARQSEDAEWFGDLPSRVGQLLIARNGVGEITLCHREDAGRDNLVVYTEAESASEIARYDDREIYRPLKTAPNLRHGWSIVLHDFREARIAVDLFYPGRVPAYEAWENGELRLTAFRETLGRQTGMYRVAANINDQQADELIGNFCRSDGGCLRTILWKRDVVGTTPSTLLPAAKFDPAFDQTGRREPAVPLLCQESCNLLVAAAREVVKASA